jgi:hypothetical protein
MGRISITIEAPDLGVATTMQLADDIPVNMLVMNLVSELELPGVHSAMPISYGLEYPRTGRSLRDGETLQSAGVQPNARLHIRARVQTVPAVSDLQFRRLKESFVYLHKPALMPGSGPAAAVTGHVARLVVDQAPTMNSSRTAPQRVAAQAAQPISGAPVVPPTQARSNPARTPPQAVQPQASAHPAVVGPLPRPPVPVMQPGPRLPATPGTPPTAGGGFSKRIIIGGGVAALLLLMFWLGARSAGTSAGPSSPTLAPQVAIGAGLRGDTTSQPDAPTAAPAQPTETPAQVPTTAPAQEPTTPPAPPSQPASQAPILAKPPIISRSSWGAQPATGSNGRQQPSRIILTHDGQPTKSTTDSMGLLQSIQRNHFKRNWVDISWHFAIDQNGAIYEGHDPTDRSDTSYDYDTNGMITVGVLGDYDSQVPSPTQIDAVVDLLSWLCSMYDIESDQIFPHSQFANQSPRTDPKITSPGRNFDLADIRRRVRDRLAGQR